jgi:hypothetical protein
VPLETGLTRANLCHIEKGCRGLDAFGTSAGSARRSPGSIANSLGVATEALRIEYHALVTHSALPAEVLRELHILARIVATTSAVGPHAVLERILSEAGLTLFGVAAFHRKVEAQLSNHPDGWAEYTRLLAHYRRVLFDEQVALRGLDSQGLDCERDWETVMQIQARVERVQAIGREAVAESLGHVTPLTVKQLFRQIDSVLADATPGRRAELIQGSGLIWIDWRDEPNDVVDAFLGRLSRYRLRLSGDDPLTLHFRKRTVSMKLRHSPADRFRLLLAINQVLHPDFEIRFARDCTGETLGFAALDSGGWEALRLRHPRTLPDVFSALSRKQDLWEQESNTPP